MDKVIQWTNRARRVFEAMIDYLETEHSETSAKNLVRAVYTKLQTLRKQPLIGRPSAKKKNIRYVLVKKRKIYYRVAGNTIHIVHIFDSRQDPKKDPY